MEIKGNKSVMQDDPKGILRFLFGILIFLILNWKATQKQKFPKIGLSDFHNSLTFEYTLKRKLIVLIEIENNRLVQNPLHIDD